jgi:hypothetical protein
MHQSRILLLTEKNGSCLKQSSCMRIKFIFRIISPTLLYISYHIFGITRIKILFFFLYFFKNSYKKIKTFLWIFRRENFEAFPLIAVLNNIGFVGICRRSYIFYAIALSVGQYTANTVYIQLLYLKYTSVRCSPCV